MTIKMLIYWTFPHLQTTQYEFVSSSKEIWEKNSITSLAHQWILCSDWVPSEWESKQLIKTSKQPTPLQYTNILWCEKLRVCMKQIYHWGMLTLNHRFWLKQHSIIHYNIPSSEKVHSLLSTHIKIHQHFCLKLLMTGTWSVHIYLLIQQDDLFFTDESNIMNREKVCKKHLERFFYITLNLLIDGLESCELLEDYCDVLSAVCILILTVPINYRGSIVEQVMQCSLTPNPFRWRNKFTSSMSAFSKFSFWCELFL